MHIMYYYTTLPKALKAPLIADCKLLEAHARVHGIGFRV